VQKKLLILLSLSLLPLVLLAQEQVKIRVHADEPSGGLKPVWAYFGHDEPNYTYSEDGQNLLRELAGISKFPIHIRTHNLLTTGDAKPALKWGSTNAYTEDAAGNPMYNWTTLDKIFDAYRDNGITPFVEIGFMPEALSTHPEPYRHHWPKGPLYTGWSYPPKDYGKWEQLIYRWVQHAVHRYGRQEVESWDWEVWNEPNGGHGYWHGSVEEYCRLYDYTAEAVKRALPSARVGGPATTGPAGAEAAEFLRNFLTHCVQGRNYATGKTGSPLDFISFHAKGRTRFLRGYVRMNIGQNLRDINDGFAIVASYPKLRDLPVVMSESDPEGCAACPAATHPENGYRNTPQYASYEADLLLGSLALARKYRTHLQGAVTWAFVFPGQPYFAGFRSLATHSVDKPVMQVFRMFGLMEGERIKAASSGALSLDSILNSSVRESDDVNVLATRGRNKVSVLVWNYNDEAISDDTVPIDLSIDGLSGSPSKALLQHYRIDNQHSDSYTAWQGMGAPQNPTAGQGSRLRAAGQLQLLQSPQWVKASADKVEIRFTLPPQGVSLVQLSW